MNKLDPQYTDLLQDILKNGTRKGDRTGVGTISTFGQFIVHNMADGFPLLTTKKMYFKGIATELIWFLNGDTNIKYLVDNGCNIWTGDAYKNFKKHCVVGTGKPMTIEEFTQFIKTDSAFAKQWGELGPIYGKQWRRWRTGELRKRWNNLTSEQQSKFDTKEENHPDTTYPVETYVDQIQNLVNDLKNNPDSRRLIVNAWNVEDIDKMVLPPCHYGFQCYTRELSLEERANWLKNRMLNENNSDFENVPSEWMNDHNVPTRAISLMWSQRSVDTFLGLPFNIASYGLLLAILGEIVNMVPDKVIGSLGDTHLYTNHLEQARQQIAREPIEELPTLRISTEFWNPGNDPEGCSGLPGRYTDDMGALFKGFEITDFQIENYKSHSVIPAPLNN